MAVRLSSERIFIWFFITSLRPNANLQLFIVSKSKFRDRYNMGECIGIRWFVDGTYQGWGSWGGLGGCIFYCF